MGPSRRLGHRLDRDHEEAEFIAQIPAHTEDDDLPVEMAAFEKKVMFDMQASFLADNSPPKLRHPALCTRTFESGLGAVDPAEPF